MFRSCAQPDSFLLRTAWTVKPSGHQQAPVVVIGVRGVRSRAVVHGACIEQWCKIHCEAIGNILILTCLNPGVKREVVLLTILEKGLSLLLPSSAYQGIAFC